MIQCAALDAGMVTVNAGDFLFHLWNSQQHTMGRLVHGSTNLTSQYVVNVAQTQRILKLHDIHVTDTVGYESVVMSCCGHVAYQIILLCEVLFGYTLTVGMNL